MMSNDWAHKYIFFDLLTNHGLDSVTNNTWCLVSIGRLGRRCVNDVYFSASSCCQLKPCQRCSSDYRKHKTTPSTNNAEQPELVGCISHSATAHPLHHHYFHRLFFAPCRESIDQHSSKLGLDVWNIIDRFWVSYLNQGNLLLEKNAVNAGIEHKLSCFKVGPLL